MHSDIRAILLKEAAKKKSNVPYSPNQFLALDFFAASSSKTALTVYPNNEIKLSVLIWEILTPFLTTDDSNRTVSEKASFDWPNVFDGIVLSSSKMITY